MAASSSTALDITFGVELEILVPYLWSDQPDPAGDTDKREAIRLSKEAMSPGDPYAAHDEVKNILRNFFRAHDIPVYDNGVPEAGPPSRYSIGQDSTVRETKFSMYNWAGIEIRSPALVAEAGSFDEIRRVVTLLRNTFRLRINDTTGFHVHVGMGAQKLPPRAIRRLSQFLWCAEGMLSQLHPPERMLNQFCPSIRHSSHLARGGLDHWRIAEEESKKMAESLGRSSDVEPAQDQEDHTKVSKRLATLQQNPNSFSALNSRLDPLRLRRFQPVRASPYENEEARRRHRSKGGRALTLLTRREFLEQGLLHPHEAGMPRPKPEETSTSIIDGLGVLCQEQMYTNTTRAVNMLSGYMGQRFNYNLLAYDFQDFGDLEVRRTVEFREEAGSLEPSWVVAWSRICSRIVEFCLQAKEDVFVDVLMRVVEAELAFEASQEELRYDVVDLLNDLSLHGEAKFVEENILTGDRDVFWFPCALEKSSSGDVTSASIMVSPDQEG